MEQGHSLTTDERHSLNLGSQIEGWGADLDGSKRPGVPRDKAPDIGVDALYPPIEPQPQKIKIYKSSEHGRMTPVFGTSCPPHGLSGVLRDQAYKLSEGRFSHWLLLLLADRVNVVEDVLSDLSHGHVPNIFKEMGLKAELQYNRKSVLKKVTIVGVGLIAMGALVQASRKSRVTPARRQMMSASPSL